MPTAENPTISKSARVMKPAVRATIPTASSTTQAMDARRKPRASEGRRRLVATTASSERPRPAATMSCSSVLTDSGITPTMDKCSPVEITAARNARLALRRVSCGRAAATSTP
ncbi:hypothetical protein ASD56_05320 [Microbacterium sp. Root166]|nr:hypothetical protein ASD56_05320 [Microbacterium sp. Root166]